MTRHDIVFQPTSANRPWAPSTLVLCARTTPISDSFTSIGSAKPAMPQPKYLRTESAGHRFVPAASMLASSQSGKYP